MNSAVCCRIELFGEFRVFQSNRNLARFRTRKAAHLLAYLALNRKRSHSREHLIDLFWPDMDTEEGRSNLSTTLSSLRRALEQSDIPAGNTLIADRQNVRLNAEAVSTDVAEFEETLHEAAQAITLAERIRLLEHAAGLYRGDLLPDCYEEWALLEQTRLQEQYGNALQQWSEALEQAGEREAALEAAQRWARTDPFCEAACQTQIRLLAALGRMAPAIGIYRALEKRFMEDLGVRPSTATRQMIERLRLDPDAFTSPPVRKHEAAPQQNPPSEHNKTGAPKRQPVLPPTLPADLASLPPRLTRFLGRTEEIERLVAMLGGEWLQADRLPPAGSLFPSHRLRLMTLTGPGGVGKTRLAVETALRLASRFADRVWFVSLADLAVPSLIPFMLTNLLKLPPAPGADALERVVEALGTRPCLLVLDNFEHLLERKSDPGAKGEGQSGSGTALVRLLLERVPGLVCLVTSRQPLHLGGEQEFPVTPLSVPMQTRTPGELMEYESVALYADRTRMINPDFTLTPANADTVAALCRKLEGMPLAIEMAAAWARILSPAKTLERLEQQLDLLVMRRRDLPSRQQSLRATIEWSYALLEPEQQRLFMRLSVFRGGWTLEAAESVWDAEVLLLLSELQERSLIVNQETESETRWRLLEPLRAFAAEKLEEAGEMNAAQQAHYGYFLSLAETASREFGGAEEKVWMNRLEAEHDNLRAAMEWCLAKEERITEGLRLAGALWRFWFVLGYWNEGQRWLDNVLERSAEMQNPLRIPVLDGAGLLAFHRGEHVRARACAEAHLALCRQFEDRLGTGFALRLLGQLASAQGDFDAARTFAEEDLALCRAVGNKQMSAWALMNLGAVARWQGNYVAAEQHYEACLTIGQALDYPNLIAYAQADLGRVLLKQGRVAAAHACFRESLALWKDIETNPGHGTVRCLEGMAQTAYARGEVVNMAQRFGQAEVLRERLHFPLPSVDRSDYDDVASARATLGPEAFDTAWAIGRALPLEQIVAEFLAETAA